MDASESMPKTDAIGAVLPPAPSQSGRPLQALLSYSDTNNLGDEIQSLAVERFLKDPPTLIDRDSLSTYIPSDLIKRKIVLNGWFSGAPENWPPSEFLDPLIVAMHISWSAAYHSGLRAGDVMLAEPFAQYLRHYGPVGARDLSTVRFLRRANIECYFSGCATLTLPRSTEERDEQLLVLNDLPPAVASSIEARTRKQVIETSHTGFPNSDPERRFQRARELLALYRRAGCVVTTRLHCALPCMAMGTPVLMIDTATDQYRFEGLSELVHHCSLADFLAGKAPFDHEHPPPPLDRHFDLADALADRIGKFVASTQGTGLPYPLSDRDLLKGAKLVQQLLVQRIQSDRRQREQVVLAGAKLLETLSAIADLDRAEALTEEQRAALTAILQAAASLKIAIAP